MIVKTTFGKVEGRCLDTQEPINTEKNEEVVELSTDIFLAIDNHKFTYKII